MYRLHGDVSILNFIKEKQKFNDQEIMALIHGGPPPLHALSLNRCDLTGASLDALVSACPHIEVYFSSFNEANLNIINGFIGSIYKGMCMMFG